MRLFITIIIILLIFYKLSFANDIKSHILKDTLVVTAERQSKNIGEVTGSVALLSREDINLSNPNTLPDALVATSGVFIQKTNLGGGSPFVRGLTGQQVLILVDGIRLNNSTTRSGPNQYLNTIDINTIQRAEIYKGQGSVEYGSDAIGGTLNLITLKPILYGDNKFHYSSELGANYMTSDMEKSASGKFDLGNDKIAVLGSVSYSDFGDLVGGDTTGKQSPSGYEQFNSNLSVTFKLNANSQLNFTSQFVNQSDVPIYHKVILEDYEYNSFNPQMRNLNYIQYTQNFNRNPLNNLNFTLFNINTEEGRILKKNNSSIERRENDKITTIGFSSQVNSLLTKYWNMSSGIETYYDFVNSTRNDINLSDNSYTNKRGLYPDNSNYNNIALFNFHNISFWDYIISFGVRYDTYFINIPEETLGDIYFNTDALVWKIGITKKFFNYHYLSGNINKSFRAPNIDDMGTLGIVDFRYEIPSNSLSPEVGFNYELNYKFINSRLWTEFSIYHNQLSDFIQRARGEVDGKDSIDGYPVYIKKNTASAYIQGAEIFTKCQINNDIILEGFLSYTFGEDLTANEPLRRIPPLNGLFSINYKLMNNLNIKAEYVFASKQDKLAKGDISDNRIGAYGTDGWNIINLYINYFVKSFSFNLRFNNLTNKDYRYHGSGINMVGRSAKIGVKYNINN